MGSFVFKWPYPAKHVFVTGTFDDWGKTEELEKVDEHHFEKEVYLSKIDEKIDYKFVVDDQWVIDEHAPKEDDGHYNVNNFLLPEQINKKVRGHRVLSTSSSPPGSNSAEGALKEAPTVSAGGSGAPLLTPEQSEANLARWIPHVVPRENRSNTRSLDSSPNGPSASGTESAKTGLSEAPTVAAGGVGAPLLSSEQSQANLARKIPDVTPDPSRPVVRDIGGQTDGSSASKPEAGDDEYIPGAFPETPANETSNFSVAPLPATGHNDIQSSVTTSQEDYENAGGEGVAGGAVGVLPVLGPGSKDVGSSATTSKEDYEKVGADDPSVSVAPLPASGHQDTQSSVTTSKEDFENAGGEGTANKDQQVSVNPLPATGHENTQTSVTTSKEAYQKAGAFGAAGAVVAGAGAYLGSVFSKPKKGDKNIIPESSLPMNPEKSDTTDTGPFLSSAGPGTTTAGLASKVPLEPKREPQVVDPSERYGPFHSEASNTVLNSSGGESTSSQLASAVPLESKREAEVVGSSGPEAPEASKVASATPFIASSGPGTTTAGLASQVPLEQKRQGVIVDEPASPEVLAEKSALEKELLQKVPESQATGEPASAAKAQSSYYGLATAVPETVEESIAKAHASPEAATETSVVAEKSAVERELQAKVPVVESAGEPAPTIAASTATTAPGTTAPSTTAAAAVDDLTGGKTANEPIPDTDTGNQNKGVSAGEIAGGAIVGGAAAAGATALAVKHNDRDVEPPRVADSQKPAITTEAAPAAVKSTTADGLTSSTLAPAGIGAASPHPGVSPVAGAALSDGTEDPTIADEPSAPKIKAPAETSEATATEYAPPRPGGLAPGVSPSAAAALSDGTEDPTLSEEPAVKMMNQNEHEDAAAAPLLGATSGPIDTPAGISDGLVYDKVTDPVGATSTSTAVPAITGAEKSVVSSTGDVPVGVKDSLVHDNVTSTVAGVGAGTSAAVAVGAGTAAATTPAATTPAAAATTPAATTPAATTPAATTSSTILKPEEVSKLGTTAPPETPKKTTAGTSSAASTPAKGTSTPESSTTGDKKKKRHRLSAMFKKIFD